MLGLPLRVARACPVRQARRLGRPVVLIEVDPDLVEVIQVPAQSETGAGSLERLRLGARRRILVIRPLLTNSGVRTKLMDRDARHHDNLRRDRRLRLVAGRLPLEVLRNLHIVGPRPSPLAEDGIQPVGVRALVRIRDHLPSFLRTTLGLLCGCRRHAPFDLAGIKWHFERHLDFLTALQ